jgi:hypothetical protein
MAVTSNLEAKPVRMGNGQGKFKYCHHYARTISGNGGNRGRYPVSYNIQQRPATRAGDIEPIFSFSSFLHRGSSFRRSLPCGFCRAQYEPSHRVLIRGDM